MTTLRMSWYPTCLCTHDAPMSVPKEKGSGKGMIGGFQCVTCEEPWRSTAEDAHPIADVQWVDPHTLNANDYNPNKVFPPELALLKASIMEDGWTHPIYARPGTREIIDGFHRWTLACRDEEFLAMTLGLVPVVWARASLTDAGQRASTIRHNRARGQHGVLKMSSIVRALVDDHGKTEAEVMAMLGMEHEEYTRLYQAGSMTDVAGSEAMGEAWVPA